MSKFFINSELESDERYDLAKFLDYSDNFDPLTSSFLLELKKLSASGEYVITDDEFKPDLTSSRIYSGRTQYWWLLMLYNNILSEDDWLVETVIQYPSIDALEDIYFTLKSKEQARE